MSTIFQVDNSPKIIVDMDGDRYQMLLPTYDDSVAIGQMKEQHVNLFLDKNPNAPYLCVQHNPNDTQLLTSWSSDNRQAIHTALFHRKGADPKEYQENGTDTYCIRPLLMPISKTGDTEPFVIQDPVGTYVYGGSLYFRNDPTRTEHLGKGFTYGLATGAYIGDTVDCRDNSCTLPWVVYKGMLLSRYVLFFSTASQAWRTGLR